MTLNSSVPTVRWGDGEPIEGTPFRIVVPADGTDGHAVGLTAELPPGGVVGEHVHHDEDQITVVLTGRLGTRVGGVEAVVEAGGVQLLPRGVPHELWNAGEEPVRMLDFYTPPGMEARFTEAGATALARGADLADGNDYAQT